MRQEHRDNSTPTAREAGAAKPNGRAEAALSQLAMEELLEALQAMQAGDFSVRLPASRTGIAGKIADTFNEIVSTNQRMAQQLERVGEVVGKEGKTRQRVRLGSN